MANVEYNQGVPSALPQTQAPDAYQDVQPLAARAMQDFGKSAVAAADFYSEAATDDAFNRFQTAATDLLYGNPQDGSTGYMGTVGAQAMTDRPAVEKTLDDLIKEHSAGLMTPAQQDAYSQAAARFRNSTAVQVSNHADQQTKTWTTQVNASTESNALRLIAANPNDPNMLAAGAAEIINARVKQAQLAGAVPGDPVYMEAVAGGKQVALEAQVTSIGATDPARALRILQQNQSIAGTKYEELYSKFETAANQQVGTQAANAALVAANTSATTQATESLTNPAQPVYRTAVETIPGGFSSPSALARLVQIESAGNPNAVNGQHVGLTQFSPSTAAEVGLTDRNNPQESILAAQRYAASNARYLTRVLGRPPTDAELYLAHQQGPGGAQKLLMNPNASAASIVGMKAVTGNGGTADMTAAQFAAMWTSKFNSTIPGKVNVGANGPAPGPRRPAPVTPTSVAVAQDTPRMLPLDTDVPEAPEESPMPSEQDEDQSPASIKAEAYQAILDDDTLNDEQQKYALAHLNAQLTAQQIAEEANAAAQKAASDDAAGKYVTAMLNGDVQGLTESIANDQNLEWNTKIQLTNAALARADGTVSGAEAAYGTGFWSAYNQILAPAGDPGRIIDPNELLRRAGPGGDLTLDGVQKLMQTLTQSQKSVDQQSVNAAQQSQMAYAKGKLSFQQDTGPIQIKDPVGEELFRARFVTKYLAAYSAHVAAGKDPWDFLTQAKTDEIMAGLRNPREMAMAQLMAQTTGMDTSQLPAPPAPAGVDETGWKLVVNSPPLLPDGTPAPADKWTQAVTLLQSRPTPSIVAQFDQFFAGTGPSAVELLTVLGVTPLDVEPAAPPPDLDPSRMPNAPASGDVPIPAIDRNAQEAWVEGNTMLNEVLTQGD